MVGRLKPGISAAQAQSDAERVAQEIMRNYPADDGEPAYQLRGAAAAGGDGGADASAVADAVSGSRGGAVDRLRQPGGLMLVRAIRRQREIAVRLALGARAGALLRQTCWRAWC